MLKEKLQEVALEAVEAHIPVQFHDGIYIGDGRVQLEPQLDVKVTVPRHLTDHTVSTSLGEVAVYNHLSVGDHVLVGRYHKEKKFVVLARLS